MLGGGERARAVGDREIVKEIVVPGKLVNLVVRCGMAELGTLYLIHGDDHGGVAGRRARLLTLAGARGHDVRCWRGTRGRPRAWPARWQR